MIRTFFALLSIAVTSAIFTACAREKYDADAVNASTFAELRKFGERKAVDEFEQTVKTLNTWAEARATALHELMTTLCEEEQAGHTETFAAANSWAQVNNEILRPLSAARTTVMAAGWKPGYVLVPHIYPAPTHFTRGDPLPRHARVVIELVSQETAGRSPYHVSPLPGESLK